MSEWMVSGSEGSHRGDEADVWTTNAALVCGHLHSFLGSGATAVFFRAVVTGATAARDTHFLGHSLVAWNFFLDGLSHTAFATFCISWGVNFFCYDIVMAGFHLAGLGAVASRVARITEHGAAGRKAKRSGNKSGEKN